jgi:hypothetical protein
MQATKNEPTVVGISSKNKPQAIEQASLSKE